MPPRLKFSQFLIGQTSLERPAFFYAYAGMWLHLFVGTHLILIFTDLPVFDAITSLTIGSFSMGILIYGLLAHEYTLFINLFSYALSMIRSLSPDTLGTLYLIIAILISLVSGYFLMASEYKRYNKEVYDDDRNGVPSVVTILMATTVLLICIFGLNLL